MVWRIFVLFLTCLVSQVILAQKSLSEIEKLLKRAVNERINRGDSLDIFVKSIASHDPKSEKHFAYQTYFLAFSEPEKTAKIQGLKKAIEYSVTCGDVVLAAECNHQIGRSYRGTDQYDSAILFYDNAIKLLMDYDDKRESFFNTKERLCAILISASHVYHLYGNYTKAIEYSLWTEKIAIEESLDYHILNASVNLGATYGELSSPENELGTKSDRDRYEVLTRKYMIKSARLAEDLGELRRAGITNFNLGTFYSFQENYDSAFLFLNKAIRMGSRIEFMPLVVNGFNTKSTLFMELNNLDSAEAYARKGVTGADSANLPRLKASALISSGNVYAAKGLLDEAEETLLAAASIANEIGHLRLAAQTYHGLHELSIKKGRYKKALEYYKEHNVYQDSSINATNFARIEELSIAYETERKDRSIEKLTQQNQIQDLELSKQRLWLFASVIGIVGLVLLGLVISLRNKKRLAEQAKESEDLRQKLLRIQLNPHFTYNSLNAIQSMIYENQDKQKTADYLSSFSSLMRNILELNQHDYITLEEELDFIENYIEVQQMRFDSPIRYHLDIDDNLPLEKLLVPPMITQPFLENSFEHAFPDKSKSGEMWIKIMQGEDWLETSITDNGVGLKISNNKDKSHNSLATKITEERLSNISTLFKRESGIAINDLYEEGMTQGTEVIIKLPLIYD